MLCEEMWRGLEAGREKGRDRRLAKEVARLVKVAKGCRERTPPDGPKKSCERRS